MPGAPLRLRCEYINNPLGITAHPRLSWWVNDTRPAEIQSAYEILAASSREKLGVDDGDMWASNRVASGNSSLVRYEGLPLSSGQQVWWKVRTFDSDGVASPWSEPASFEMGLLREADWHAYWVASPLYGSRSRAVHVSALRREFQVAPGLSKARLYIAGLGDYRVSVNGSGLPDTVCGGVWSDFDHEYYYQTLDLTEQLNAGTNVLGVLLGDGYYAGSIPGAGRCVYANRPALRAMLMLEFESGRQVLVSTDHQWRWRASWILAAETCGGEHVDARQLDPGWDTVGYVNRGWAPVDVIPDRPGVARAIAYSPVGIQQALRPLETPDAPEPGGRTSVVIDFGEQLMGRIRARLVCAESDDIVFHYALTPDFVEATSDAYTSTGQGTEVYATTFALHGFRYVRVAYTGGLTQLQDIHALRIAQLRPAMMRVRTDHATLNQLLEVMENSLATVAMSVPLAGARVSERLPHAGLAGTWMPFAARLNELQPLIQKWIADLKLACERGDDAGPFVPRVRSARLLEHTADDFVHFEALAGSVWACFRHQGDVSVLQTCYPGLRAAALSYRHRYPDLLREPVAFEVYGRQTTGLIATATVYRALRICARIASVLGNLGDVELIDTLAGQVRNAFRRRYLTTDGHLLGDTQSACVVALYHGLLDDGERRIAEARLLDLMHENQYHADVVPAAAHALLPTLTRAGRLDVAYMVLLQTSLPGWLGTVASGERLLGRQPGHMSMADLGLLEWLLESLIGISLDDAAGPDAVGYRDIIIRPMPPLGAQFPASAPVEFVSVTLETVSGQIALRWEIKDSSFELEVSLPPNCKAMVVMPDGIEQRVQSGWHRFVMDIAVGGDGVPTLLERASG